MPIREVLSTPDLRLVLDNPWHAKQIACDHRGARQVPAENKPVEPAWVMPAKGQRRASEGPAKGQRRECALSKTAVLLCPLREPSVTVMCSRQRVCRAP